VDSFDDGGLATFITAADKLELGVEFDRDLSVKTVITNGDLLETHRSDSVT